MTTTDLSAAEATLYDLRDEPHGVRQALAALGRLLGEALVEPARDLNSFVGDHLQAPKTDVTTVSALLRGIDAPLVHVAVARLLERAPYAVLADDTGTTAPGYLLVTVDVDEQVAAPNDLAAYLPAGSAFGFDAVLVLTWRNGCPCIVIHSRTADTAAARSALSELIERARTTDNFYRGKTLSVEADNSGITVTPVRASVAERADVIHEPQVWREIDANIGGLVRHGAALAAAGLGAARGVLVVGPPGVGKTALCRVIAAELPAGTTIVLADSSVSPGGLSRIYESLDALSPAAVFLDDIDLLAGDRRSGTGDGVLREFLTHLDGFTPPAAVITVATTNVTHSIDPALIRPGRFDAVIEVGAPGQAGRAEILRRYLKAFGEFDVDRIAAATGGATGADLREVVRRAVLERGPELSSADLLDVVSSGRWKPEAPTGQYL